MQKQESQPRGAALASSALPLAVDCGLQTVDWTMNPPTPARPAIRVGRETKGRAGKGVTVVTGLPLARAQLEALARDLKKRCGSGGTVRDGVIEIQGEHRDTVVQELTKLGYQAKRSGG